MPRGQYFGVRRLIWPQHIKSVDNIVDRSYSWEKGQGWQKWTSNRRTGMCQTTPMIACCWGRARSAPLIFTAEADALDNGKKRGNLCMCGPL